MRTPRLLLFSLPLAVLALSLVTAGLRQGAVAGGGAIPAPSSDTVGVSADVTIVSRIGSETIHLTGTATIDLQAPEISSGHELIAAQLAEVDLTATSDEGEVHVTLAFLPASSGEFRGVNAAPSELPATSFFDAYLNVEVPAAPEPSVILHNITPLHLETTSNITSWPLSSVEYALAVSATTPTPSPTATPPGGMPDCGGIPLLPQNPLFVCITDVSLTIDEVGTPTVTPTSSVTPTWTPFTPPPSWTRIPTDTPTWTVSPTPFRNGDANCDGTVTAVDAALDLQVAAGMIPSPPCGSVADVNGDGRVDALDALLTLQFVAGLLSHLPV